MSNGANAASTDTGSASPVMTVERHELRKRNTTSTVSAAPSTNVSSTLRTELRMRVPPSRTISSRVPTGSRVCSSAIRARMPSLTAVVLASRDLMISRPMANVPLNIAADVGSAAPASTSASSPSRRRPRPRVAITICANSSGRSSRPSRRITRRSSAPFTRPTGAAMFCERTAFTT